MAPQSGVKSAEYIEQQGRFSLALDVQGDESLDLEKVKPELAAIFVSERTNGVIYRCSQCPRRQRSRQVHTAYCYFSDEGSILRNFAGGGLLCDSAQRAFELRRDV